ncbi:hypothetical protein EYR40_009937 [Pleurotus pulmonarius]|nr:hypothetical protein EYR40_009937 [Pleurotus pulmonarius]
MSSSARKWPLSDIRPLSDGVYYIWSVNYRATDLRPFLYVFPPDNVGLSVNEATRWNVKYIVERGCYIIWEHGTNRVLDATRVDNAAAITYPYNGENWQCWAPRMQLAPFVGPNQGGRVSGFSLTPLSQPPSALTMSSLARDAAMPAKLATAPRDGAFIQKPQLWAFTPVQDSRRTYSMEVGEGGEEEGCGVDDACFTEEVQAQIVEARKRIAIFEAAAESKEVEA